MPSAPFPERGTRTAQRAFNTTTVTVGGLYLATHSVVVTITGTAAASLLTCWTLWLARRDRAANESDAVTTAPRVGPGAVATPGRGPGRRPGP